MCAGPKLRWLDEYRFSSGSLYILQNGGKLALIANCGIPNYRPIKIEKNRFVNEKCNGVTAKRVIGATRKKRNPTLYL